ncbi:MAG: hypothetical protein IT585_01080 [candidate division Zixibacteria bacterium]|nr:hypothetical protein [candidate division Zixibacteria bacterium]
MSLNPIGLIKKAFGIFKKASAVPPPAKGAADIPFQPDDNVVLVFGHSNAGKTVYFSVLYELLKGNPEYKLSPLDNETAAALIENYNLMRGKQIKIKEGRQVEIEGERKFPTMTSETRVLKFGLDMSIRKGIKFYTVDYKGETLSIAEPGGLRKQFARFFPYARAALFFIDASVLDTDVLLREQIAAFQTIINDLRDCAPKKVPIGIVITKADFLEGFSPSNPVELIPANAAVHKGKSVSAFIKGLATVNQRRFGEVWARSCERVTRTLANLIDSMTSYNLDFQFFFVTATGGLEKVAAGAVQPPREITPSGVPDPLVWSFNRILFNKRKQFWWRITKWVIGLSIVWMALYSAFNLYHVAFIYDDQLKRAEDGYNKAFISGPQPIDQATANIIKSKFDDYLKRMPVAEFFGAKPMIDYAKARQQFTQSQVSADAKPLVEEVAEDSPYKAATDAAKKDYKKIADDVGKLPPGEQQAAFDTKMTEFWQKHPADSLDPAFVKKVEGAQEQFKSGGTAVAEQKFEIELTIQGLRDRSQVVAQIGTDPYVEFSNFSGTPTVSQKITGVGNAPVTFKWLDLTDQSIRYEQAPFENPIETFYPKLETGVRLDFGRDYNLIVKRKSGTPPKPPSVPQI